MFFAIATFAAFLTGWTLAPAFNAWLLLWALLGGTGWLLDLIFASSLGLRPSPPPEANHAKGAIPMSLAKLPVSSEFLGLKTAHHIITWTKRKLVGLTSG